MRSRTILALGCALVLAATGCAGGDTAATTEDPVTLRYAAVGAPAAMTHDPHGRVGNESDYLRFAMLYDVLTVPDEQGVAQPRLALSWEAVDGDLTRWRIALRDDAVFSDGSPVTADDVLFSLRRIQGKGAENNGRLSMFDLESSRVTGEHELELRTHQPYAEVGGALAALTFIVPEGTGEITEPVPGSGPFAPAGGDDTTAVLERNDAWWGQAPRVERLEITAMPDPAARAAAVASGQADVAGSVSPVSAQQYAADETMQVVTRPASVNYPLVMNLETEPFDDPRVREAVKLALDREELVETVFLGYGTPGTDVVSPAEAAAPEPRPVERDVEQARELLAEAGHEDGVSLTLHTTTSYPGMEDAAVLAAEQLGEAGIDVTVDSGPPDTYWSEVWNVEPFYLNSLGGSAFVDFARMALVTDGPINETGWAEEEWDADLADALATADDEERRAMIADLQQRVAEEGGYVVWGVGDGIDLARDEVSGLPTGLGFQRLFIDQVDVAG
ncbi:ABC transporter substrate-binding protein [Marinactinospora thermotolerans]|uniref:Peptide/nickel transport system substrate-binding protein n=1 Tax=Marinactinospora thermotolerans DSM 45154 TaxID=1122192 RepID=A0A1T4NK32_9ACTN|nr:ABC transporter substrate-binding protein [Marinactinospora thermotolerans]SJZ79624.1 peptide/nickel transport system substrate-binding protein [Marinactinospora thermotolerans DSM 45154]